MPKPLILYGSTGHAASVREEIETVFKDRDFTIAAFIDDDRQDGEQACGGVPVIRFETWVEKWRAVPVIVTVSTPGHRRRLVRRIEEAAGRFESMVGTSPSIARNFIFGEGSFVGGSSYIGPGARIGRHVQVQPLSFIGHDSSVGDFSTICSSHIAGCVEIGADVFIGIGSSIVHGTAAKPLRIGDGAFIAAGSVVTKSVPAGTKVMGNPARPVRALARVIRGRGLASRAEGE